MAKQIAELGPSFNLSPQVFGAIKRLGAKHWPPNWGAGLITTEADLNSVRDILYEEAIPLVWVPRSDICRALIAAKTKGEREGVLLNQEHEILDDCQAALDEVSHSSLTHLVPLANKASVAYRNDGHEAAQALAMLVADSPLFHAKFSGGYVARSSALQREQFALEELKVVGAWAPLSALWAACDTKMESAENHSTLSRHRTVHNPTPEQYGGVNPLLTIMIMTSTLRGMQHFIDINEAFD